MRFVSIHVEDDRNQEDKPLHRSHPCASETRGDEARFDHPNDETAEPRTQYGRAAAKDRRAADEHRGDGRQQIALALIAEVVLVLERQHDRGAGSEKAHEGENLYLLAVDVYADDARDVIGIADEQGVLAEAMAGENEPQEPDDDRRPQRLDRHLLKPSDIGQARERAPDDPLPDRTLFGPAQRVS